MCNLGPCMTWVPILWGRILSSFSQTQVVDLPHDNIMDIFSRLPAELVSQCRHPSRILRALTSSQSFIDLHLNRATSVIVIFNRYNLTCRFPHNNYEGEVSLYFVDNKTKMIVPKSMPFRFGGRVKFFSDLTLFDSYKGLLLFQNNTIFVTWNPITEEQVIVHKPYLSHTRGFFLDPKTREYKILFMHELGSSFQFIIYTLGTRSSRKSTQFSHAPFYKAPVLLNSTLHWMVYEQLYEQATGSSLRCSESIVLFDTDSENIRTMARPGSKYDRRTKDAYVHLLKMGELLCFCDATASYRYMDIWVLEDYAQEVWINKYTINLEFMGRPLGSSPRYLLYTVKVDNDELLLRWKEDLFHYNLKSNKPRKIELRGIQGRVSLCSFVSHTNSFVSVLSNDTITFQR